LTPDMLGMLEPQHILAMDEHIAELHRQQR
jgi:hypothetical protein